VKQLAGLDRSAPVFVSATLTVQKYQVKLHQPSAELSEAFAIVIHDFDLRHRQDDLPACMACAEVVDYTHGDLVAAVRTVHPRGLGAMETPSVTMIRTAGIIGHRRPRLVHADVRPDSLSAVHYYGMVSSARIRTA